MSARHLSKVLDWMEAECGELITPEDTLPTSNPDAVECKACLAIMANTPSPSRPIHWIHNGIQWANKTSRPYKCGAMDGIAVTGRADVTCPDCLNLMGGGTSTPHTPPYMANNDDGLFVFFDTRLGPDYGMEVVPQTSGNVEITISYGEDGHLFTLSHLDRADLIRALLHDFHYSPERGGPNDEV